LATHTTNIFNALSDISQSMQLQLTALALGGNSPVSNAFTEEADRLGLTEKGRERKEREDRKRFAEQMEAIRDQARRMQEQFDRLEQACTEALLENEEQQRTARKDLEEIRERAYAVKTPDGKVVKVYRDGDTVRDDAGALVAGIGPEEMPDTAPTWSQRKTAGDVVERLEKERHDIIEYQDKLGRSKERLSSGEAGPDELAAMEAAVERMPEAVRRHFPKDEQPAGLGTTGPVREPGTFATIISPAKAFTTATQTQPDDPQSDLDFTRLPPSASAPAPR